MVESWNYLCLVSFFLLFSFKQEGKPFRAFCTCCLIQSLSRHDQKVGRLRSRADLALHLTAADSWALWPLLRLHSLILGVGTIMYPPVGWDKCDETGPRWYLVPWVPVRDTLLLIWRLASCLSTSVFMNLLFFLSVLFIFLIYFLVSIPSLKSPE